MFQMMRAKPTSPADNQMPRRSKHHHRFEGCEEMVARGERADPAHGRVHGFAGPARRHGDRARGVRAGDDQGAHQVVEILDNENDTRDAGDTLQ